MQFSLVNIHYSWYACNTVAVPLPEIVRGRGGQDEREMAEEGYTVTDLISYRSAEKEQHEYPPSPFSSLLFFSPFSPGPPKEAIS